tara:strand:+ start:261 stop:440 length:180 start_codon:yes stop_codon:yes gene_type:complete
MAKNNTKGSYYAKKKSRQGEGKFSKKPSSGGERFGQGFREGSPPSKFRRKRKPSRGQGK